MLDSANGDCKTNIKTIPYLFILCDILFNCIKINLFLYLKLLKYYFYFTFNDMLCWNTILYLKT